MDAAGSTGTCVWDSAFPSLRWGNVAESVEGFAEVTDVGSSAG